MVEYVRKKPFLIAMAMALLGFFGIVGTLVVTVILLTAVFGNGPYTMNGEAVSKGQFLQFTIPFSILYLACCVYAGLIAWFIHSERPQSRLLLLGWLVAPFLVMPVLAAFGETRSDILSAVAWWAPIVLLGWLYLYHKKAVVEYYESLSERHIDEVGEE